MITLEHILVATDFSACSNEALDYALHLGQKLKGRLTLLHVFESPFFYPAEISIGAYPEVYQWLQDFKQEEIKRLNALADQAGKRASRLNRSSNRGFPLLKSSEQRRKSAPTSLFSEPMAGRDSHT